MAKNILVFADGTGNEGGLLPDESRTNVYKLFRATRNGPDSSIDPRKQVAFYLYGIGTPTPGGSPRKIRQTFERMFGSGLGSRTTDGYWWQTASTTAESSNWSSQLNLISEAFERCTSSHFPTT